MSVSLPRPSLDGVRVKLARACLHARELEDALRPIVEPAPDNFVRDPQVDPTKLTFSIVKVPDLDPDWSAIAGDALNNLRAAYDYLAYQLIYLEGRQEPTDKTKFPIFKSSTDQQGKPIRLDIKPGITRADILTALDAVQPYKAHSYTSDLLWALNKLCNVDKHRLLLVMTCAMDHRGIWWGLPKGAVSPSFKINWGPLKSGDPVAWFDFGDDPAPPKFELNLGLTVKLNEGPAGSVIRAEPVVDLLHALAHRVARDLNESFIDLLAEEYVVCGTPDSRLTASDMARGSHPTRAPHI